MLAELSQALKSMHLFGMATALAELTAEPPRHAAAPGSGANAWSRPSRWIARPVR